MSPVESPVFLKTENFLHLELESYDRAVREIQRSKGGDKHDPPLLEEAEKEMQASVLQPLTFLLICYSSHRKLIQQDKEKRGMKNGNYRTHSKMVYLIQRQWAKM